MIDRTFPETITIHKKHTANKQNTSFKKKTKRIKTIGKHSKIKKTSLDQTILQIKTKTPKK